MAWFFRIIGDGIWCRFSCRDFRKKQHLKLVKQVDITVVRHSVRAIGQVGSASVLGA